MIGNITGVTQTAWYCCGARWQDSRRKAPVCGDHLAELFMTEEARAVFSRFAGLRIPNAMSATRTRIFDDWLRDRLLADPEQMVIVLGAGLDTRSFRLPGGRWIEVDTPGLIDAKNRLLPAARSPQPLSRIAVDFGQESLADRLSAFDGEHPVIVMEGVSMYLTQPQLRSTLSALGWAFPRHTLYCDLMSAGFASRYGAELRRRLAEIGGRFADDMPAEPARKIVQQGYRQLARRSIAMRARELGALPLPALLLNSLLTSLRDGYAAHAFEAGAERPLR